jgi:hypothetical protein
MAVLRTEADSLTKLVKSASDPARKEELSVKLRKINENRISRIENIKK